MKHPEVRSLFKYCTINQNQLSALLQEKIWYSKPARFNDPFDTKFKESGRKIVATLNSDTPKHRLDEIFGKDTSGMMIFEGKNISGELSTFRSSINNLGILSLATNNDNLLMWAHYASNHFGMCLEFDRNEASLLASDACNPVQYSNNYPSLNTNDLLSQSNLSATKNRILNTKSKHWEYEKEWRHIVNLGDKLHPFPSILKAVYFGCKTTESNMDLVKKVISVPNVKYYKFHQNKGEFKIFSRVC